MRILKTPPVKHPFTPFKIAIVTGLSNPRSCELSLGQQQLLSSFDVPEQWKVQRNFPFVEASSTKKNSVGEIKNVATPGIIPASLANGRQFLASHMKKFRRLANPHWRSLLDSTDHLIMITGSCGIQLANTIERNSESVTNIAILALGPVSIRRSKNDVTTLLGTRDYVSRLFYRNGDHSIAGLGHLNYWYNAQVREMSANWLSNKISELSEQEVTSLNER